MNENEFTIDEYNDSYFEDLEEYTDTLNTSDEEEVVSEESSESNTTTVVAYDDSNLLLNIQNIINQNVTISDNQQIIIDNQNDIVDILTDMKNIQYGIYVFLIVSLFLSVFHSFRSSVIRGGW